MEGNESHQFIDLIFHKLLAPLPFFYLLKKILHYWWTSRLYQNWIFLHFVLNSFIDVSFIDKQRPLNTYLSWGWYVIASRAQINFINTFWYLVYFFQLWYKNVKEICWKKYALIFLFYFFSKKLLNNENFPPQFLKKIILLAIMLQN